MKHQRIASLITVKKRWRKLRLWVGIRCMLGRMQMYVIDKMRSDPSNPLYALLTHSNDVAPVMDERNRILFDASYFKANRQMRTTQEVRRILTLTSDERTEEDIYCVRLVSLQENTN